MQSENRGSPLWQSWLKVCQRRSNEARLIEAPVGRTWTADALTQRSTVFFESFASYRAGERIAFQLPNGADWIAFFLAIQRFGLTAIPLDISLPPAGAREIARYAGATALFFGGQLHSLKSGRRSPGCCCVKVTSGSEGIPKLVSCRAEHLLADGRQIIATMKIRPNDRNLAVIPLGHSYGLGNLVMPLILQGTAMITAGEYVPRQLAEWIDLYRITVLPVVPALVRVLAGLSVPSNFSALRTVISAGAVLSPEVAQAFFQTHGLKVHNFYGTSETGGICYDRTGNASLTGKSVGKPLAGVSLVVKKGRLTVLSPAVATRTGRWRLGDLGEWNGRKELVLLGRLGQEANIGGRKVHPREVESALRSVPAVTDVAVWTSLEKGRDVLAAAVETGLSRSEIEQALAERLPAWKLPRKYFLAEELPRTSRGKLDAKALRKRVD
jgi:long-chain acyl-CoA synthetase